MMRTTAAAAALIVAGSGSAGAHRLDEYLQAARVEVTTSTVVVHLDLTPGVSIAGAIVDLLDGDRDGRVSPEEAGAYGRAVMGDLAVRLDGSALTLDLTRVEVSTIEELRAGLGTIRVQLRAAPSSPTPGRHVLELHNAHRPERSAYLANALMPETPDVTVLRQERDSRQQWFRLQYETSRPAHAPVWWLLVGAAGLTVHTRWRLRVPVHPGVR
jgi:hypothetical protein